MKDLSPFDASILNVWTQIPEGMEDARQELLDLLEEEGTDEGREIVRALRAPDLQQAEASPDAKATAASLLRKVGVPG